MLPPKGTPTLHRVSLETANQAGQLLFSPFSIDGALIPASFSLFPTALQHAAVTQLSPGDGSAEAAAGGEGRSDTCYFL